MDLKEKTSDPSIWKDNKKTASLMKEISIIEKDIELRKILSQKADDIEVLYDFLNNNQVTESEFEIELENFSKLIKEFELKLIRGENRKILNLILLIFNLEMKQE